MQCPLSFLNACCGSEVPRKLDYGWVQPWRGLIQSAAPLVIQFSQLNRENLSKHLNTFLVALDMCHIVSFWTLGLISYKIVLPECEIYKPWF